MERIVNIVAIVLVVLVGLGVGGAVLVNQFNSPPEESERAARHFSPVQQTPRPRTPTEAATSTAAAVPGEPVTSLAPTPETFGKAEVAGNAETVVQASAPAAPPKVYTWPEAEAMLEEARQARNERPSALDELSSRYNFISHPSFTQSQNLAEHIAKLEKWREEFPQSPALLVVLAKACVSHAWEARGTGFAYTVTEEGWELFNSRIAKAREFVDEARKLAVKDGEAYDTLLVVARAEGLPLEQTRAILEEGMRVDSAYAPMYATMAEYLLPRWHGQPGDVERFAEEVVDLVPGDDGLDAYGHIAYVINQYDCLTENSVFRGGFDRELLVKAAEVLVKRYPTARNLPCFAALCTIAAQDQAAARRIRPFVKHDDAPRVQTWQYHAKEFHEWCDTENLPGGEDDWIWGSRFHYGNIGFASNSRYVWCGQGGVAGRAAELLDLDYGGARMILASPRGHLQNLAFAPGENWLAGSFVGPDFQGIAFWDASIPGDSPTLVETSARCEALALHPTLPRVAWAAAKEVHVVDILTGEQIPPLAPGGVVQWLKFSPDGKRLALGGSVYSVWDTTTWQRVCEFPALPAQTIPNIFCNNFIDIDEEGRVLAVATKTMITDGKGDSKLQVVRFDADGKASDTLISDIREHGMVKTYLARLSPDRRWLAVPEQHAKGTGSERIDLWDVNTGKRTQSFGGHWNGVGDLAFSTDSRLLASISRMSGVIKTWKIPDPDTPSP